MKKTLFTLLAAICFLAQPSMAQKKFTFVLSDGFNFSSLAGLKDATPNLGFYSEASANMNLYENWGVELGIAFSEQGTKVNYEADTSAKYDYAYFNIPLFATYTIEKYGITAMAGVQAGKFLMGHYTLSTPSLLEKGEMVETQDKLPSSEFHPWDFGVSLGLRIETVPEWGMGFDIRYTLGITQTHNGISNSIANLPYISVPDNRNSVLRIGVYLAF